ncbi:ZN551 protein, partial [Rhinoptilus africanus]|nr:ZN551 protein [Rhinoptilus africanus]
FTHSSNLLLHRRTHAATRPHECPTCTKAFVSDACLQKHLQSHATMPPLLPAPAAPPETLWRCSNCPLSFTSEEELLGHQSSHSVTALTPPATPHHCSTCGKTFKNSSGLARHRHGHAAERPFKCTVCPKTFTQLSGLLAHQRSH